MLRKKRGGRRPILNLQSQTLIPSEYQECKTYWEYAKTHPILKKYLVKIPNERIDKEGWFTKALIAIGMRPGIQDYQLPCRNDKYIGLWLEVKRRDEKGKKLRVEQQHWHDTWREVGHYTAVAYGCDEAIKITLDYLANQI